MIPSDLSHVWKSSALGGEVETGVKDFVMKVKNISNKNIYVVRVDNNIFKCTENNLDVGPKERNGCFK